MNPVIILVAPQMGENIGATARAMKNFGLTNLRIVAPRDGWPNDKASSVAVAAIDILAKAKIYDDLASSIADLEYVYATTSVPRDMNKSYLLSKELPDHYPTQLKVGIMFGRENCGLTNQEITIANKIITIDTDHNFSSLNIAQAVIIICYELFKSQERTDLVNTQLLATKEQMEYFFAHLFTELDKKNFFKVAQKRPQMTRNIMNLFYRIENLSNTELQTLRGVISALTKNK